ncbi:hypothetical protein MTR62_05055 [Novosphingobium sp. 1949]|uniref:Transmembrane protein n=1 Tax=Novosphingobium organovorum TaxID=2930092 RepID=A0ABT0BB49_9SPHN|nr:hypothetical protein [Novosphingobium organovorum]MCJ2182073.1 hypothetical protein [Novosphingobium organovorum]
MDRNKPPAAMRTPHPDPTAPAQSPLAPSVPTHAGRPPAAPIDWRRRMSDHIAYALLVYTALQIFVTIGALKAGEGSLLPYFALIVLVMAIIPACRHFEARWNRLTDREARDPALAATYRRDRAGIWAIAIGLPFVLTGVFKLLALLFS